MTIPDKPLTVKVEANDLTLDEVCLFQPGGFEIIAFRTFLRERTNWTHAEVGALKVGELQEVAEHLRDALRSTAVPKARSPRSKRGRGSTRTARPAG